VPSISDRVRETIDRFRVAIDASLDPVCIVDASNHILYFNLPMRSLLKLKLRQIQEKKICFCDVLKLSVCSKRCRILEALATAEIARYEEIPAARGPDKFRMTVKVAPYREVNSGKNGPVVGAFITIRDVTGEFLVQAKYHKALEIIEQRTEEIQDLEFRVRSLQQTLKRSRGTWV
jgi:PAS domain-containing protein